MSTRANVTESIEARVFEVRVMNRERVEEIDRAIRRGDRATCSQMLMYALNNFEAHVGRSFTWLEQAGSEDETRAGLEAYGSLAMSGRLRRADLPDIAGLLGPFASAERFSFGHPVEVWLDGTWVGNGADTELEREAIPWAVQRRRFRTSAPRVAGAEVLGCERSGPIRNELARANLLVRDFDTHVVPDGGYWVAADVLQRWLDAADGDVKYDDWRASMRDVIARIRGVHEALLVFVDDPGPSPEDALW